MAVTIPYPKIWNSGEILTAADLNAEFAAVTGISNIPGTALAVGAAVNNFQSAAFNAVAFTTVETTIVTLPAVTTRGGLVAIIGQSGYFAFPTTTAPLTLTTRFKRDATLVNTVTNRYDNTTTSGVQLLFLPVPTLVWFEAPAAGTYVYSITMQTSSGNLSIGNSASMGRCFIVELS